MKIILKIEIIFNYTHSTQLHCMMLNEVSLQSTCPQKYSTMQRHEKSPTHSNTNTFHTFGTFELMTQKRIEIENDWYMHCIDR